MEKKRTKQLIWMGILMLFLTLVFFLKEGKPSNAADSDVWLVVDGKRVDPSVEIELTSAELQLTLKSAGDMYTEALGYKVKWFINAGESYAQVTPGTNSQFIGIVKALNPGIATITVEVTDSVGGDKVATATCKVKVIFSVDTDRDINHFKKLYENSAKKSIFLTVGESLDLQLNIGSVNDAQWSVENEDVVKVGNDQNATGKDPNCKGRLTATGAGKTSISTEYATSGTSMTGSIDVYVIPSVTVEDKDKTASGIQIENEDVINTDAYFGKNNTQSIKDKIIWVISKDREDGSGTREVIEDSLGNRTSDLIELVAMTSDSRELYVKAKAGRYFIDFYTAGTYESETKRTDAYKPNTLDITVYAEFFNYNVTLNIQDGYSIADAFNLTLRDFVDCFDVGVDNEFSNYISYDRITGTVTAKTKGTAKVQIDGKAGKEAFIKNLHKGIDDGNGHLIKDTRFTITINIIDGLTLDQTNLTMTVGQERKLSATTTSYDGIITWKSSDEKYVTVTQNGVVTARAQTKDNQDIIITVTQKMSDGNIKNATCRVKVIATISDMKLDKDNVVIKPGGTENVNVSFKPNTSTAPLVWLSTDTKNEFFSFTVSADKKGIVIKGLKSGKGTITCMNQDNNAIVVCQVTILSPITSITLSDKQISVKLNREVVRLKASYQPSDATSTDLVWESSDTSVATVDSAGLVTLLKAGITSISVRPYDNTGNVKPATCTVTIIQSSTGLSLSTTSLTMEAGSTQKIDYTLVPANATSKVTFLSLEDSVASVSANGVVTAKNSGKTTILVTSEEGYTALCTVVVTQKATGIALDVYNLNLAVGDTYQVTSKPVPATATETTLTWTSKDPSVATVSGNGKVTGVGAGSTIILVKTQAGKVEYVYVTVRQNLTGMKLNAQTKTISINASFTLEPVFTPNTVTNKNMTYKSSNTGVATVTAKGVVKGIKGGVSIISGTAEDGGYVDTCIVTVTEKIDSITLSPTSYKLGVGKSKTLKATLNSESITNQKLRWTSSNIKVATVDKNGKVTAKKIGTAVIRCSSTDGSAERASCTITVVKQVTGIKLSKTTLRMLEARTTKLTAKVTPSTASYKGVTWSSTDTKVATVDSGGNIYAVKEGTCQIIAKAKDSSKKQDSCWVYVTKLVPASNITVSSKDMVMLTGSRETVNISIQPSNTTDGIRYASDNTSVASVSSKGQVTARKPGVATITVTTTSGKQAVVNVTVIGLNKTSATMTQYDKLELWVEGVPTGVTWDSSSPSTASVANGTVTARRAGTVVVTATVRGVKLACRILVETLR